MATAWWGNSVESVGSCCDIYCKGIFFLIHPGSLLGSPTVKRSHDENLPTQRR